MNKKQQQEKFVKQLEDLLKRPENRNCADCAASGPRFASTNLGIFICTRCAGLHRKLGVHVTKVKSISHDTWTAEQVQFMQQTGNKKAKEKYEYKAPRATTETDNALYDWIQRKYELKAFLRPEGVIDTGSDDEDTPPPPAAMGHPSGIQAVPVPGAGVPPAAAAYASPSSGWQAAPVPPAQPQDQGVPSKADLLALYNPPAPAAPAPTPPMADPNAAAAAAPPGMIPVYMMGPNGAPVMVYLPASQLAGMQAVQPSAPAPAPVPVAAAPPPANQNPFGGAPTVSSAPPSAASPFAPQPTPVAQAPSPFGQPQGNANYGQVQVQASPFAPAQPVAQQQSPFGQPQPQPTMQHSSSFSHLQMQPQQQQQTPFGQPQPSPYGQPQYTQPGMQQQANFSPFAQPQGGF